MPFNIGAPEMLIIMVIALIVFGPAKLPEMGKTIGKAMREFRRASSELTDELTREVDVKKEQERKVVPAISSAESPTSYTPAQTQAYSDEPATALSEPILGAPQDLAKSVDQDGAQPVTQDGDNPVTQEGTKPVAQAASIQPNEN